MANQYKNKIIYGNQTLMDITDTTATENDVLEGEVFYSASGARSVGLLGDATQSAHGLMSAADKTKLDGFLSASNYLTSHQDISGKANSADLATVATTGSYADLLNKPDLSQYLTSVPTMTGATSSADGTAGLIPAPTTADAEKFFRGDGTWQDGGRPMVILAYGQNTWADFLEAYTHNVIVYCRASSNSNPATGQQLRMAFMAYVAGNASNPTEVEFQYYRSVNAHSATQMSDQVYIYKLTNKGVWSVIVREAGVKQVNISGSGLSASWSNNQVTLSNTMTAANMPMSSSDATTVGSAISGQSQAIAKVQNGLAFIVGNTNTTGSTLAVGQFIYVKGHSTIAEGLRKVTASISANGNITTSNTSACSEGGLNALISNLGSPSSASSVTGADAFSKINTLNNNMTTKTSQVISEQSGVVYCVAYKKAGWVTVIGHSAGQRQLTGSGAFQYFETLPEAYRPGETQYGIGTTASGVGIAFEIGTDGLIKYLTPNNATYWYYSFSYPTV